LPLISLFFVAFVGSVFWVFNAEGLSVYYASSLGYPPLVIGLTCAVAQCSAYSLLYIGGDKVLVRWQWLKRRVERTRERWGAQLERHFLWITAFGAFVGLPPAITLVAIAPMFRVRFLALLPILFVARVLRFSTLAFAGGSAVGLVQRLAGNH
jgi:membrane protein YqaA with SNARE-associated domain